MYWNFLKSSNIISINFWLCLYVTTQRSVCRLSSDFYPLACESCCREPSFRRCYLQFFLSPDSEGSFSQMRCKMNEPGIQRGELLSLPSLSCFLASPGFALSCCLTCDNAPDLFVEFSWLLGLCSEQ